MLFAHVIRHYSSKLLKCMLAAHAICSFLPKHSWNYVGFMCKILLIIKTCIPLCGLQIPYVLFVIWHTGLHRSLHTIPTLWKDRIILKRIYKHQVFHVLYYFVSFLLCFLGPPSVIFHGYRGIFLWGEVAGVWK